MNMIGVCISYGVPKVLRVTGLNGIEISGLQRIEKGVFVAVSLGEAK